MSDPLESMLDRLDAGPGASEPAPAFLRAVARRRRRRRAMRAGSAAAVLVAAAALWLMARSTLPAIRPAPQLAGGTAPEPALVQVSSLAALTRANLRRDVGDLDLPEPSASGGERPLRLGVRLDSARLERWLSQ